MSGALFSQNATPLDNAESVNHIVAKGLPEAIVAQLVEQLIRNTKGITDPPNSSTPCLTSGEWAFFALDPRRQQGSHSRQIVFPCYSVPQNNFTKLEISHFLRPSGYLLYEPTGCSATLKTTGRSGAYRPFPGTFCKDRAVLPNNYHTTSCPSGRERGAAKEARRMDASSVFFLSEGTMTNRSTRAFRRDTCPTCDGAHIVNGRLCTNPECGGTGFVTRPMPESNLVFTKSIDRRIERAGWFAIGMAVCYFGGHVLAWIVR